MKNDKKDKQQKQQAETVGELVDRLKAKYGPRVIMRGSEVPPIEFVSTGIKELDEACNGGWPKGRVVEVWGPKSAGKTSLVLHVIAAMQRADPKVKIAYFDLENTYTKEWASQLGVDTERLIRVGAMYAEDLGDLLVKMVRKRWGMVVVDSIIGLLPGKELERSLDTATPGVLAMMLSRILPKVIVLQGQSPTIVVLVNQVRDKFGLPMYGEGAKSPGGHALEHFDSLKIRVQRKGPVEKNGERIGHEIALKVIKSKVGIEDKDCRVKFIWGKGFR